MHPEVVDTILNEVQSLGGQISYDAAHGQIAINAEFTASFVIARCGQSEAGSLRWMVRLEWATEPDIIIAARMDADNQHICDYYLLPTIVMRSEKVRLCKDNGLWLDAFRFDSLDYLFGMAQHIKLEVAV